MKKILRIAFASLLLLNSGIVLKGTGEFKANTEDLFGDLKNRLVEEASAELQDKADRNQNKYKQEIQELLKAEKERIEEDTRVLERKLSDLEAKHCAEFQKNAEQVKNTLAFNVKNSGGKKGYSGFTMFGAVLGTNLVTAVLAILVGIVIGSKSNSRD